MPVNLITISSKPGQYVYMEIKTTDSHYSILITKYSVSNITLTLQLNEIIKIMGWIGHACRIPWIYKIKVTNETLIILLKTATAMKK